MDYEKLLKLEFYPWVHSRTLETRKRQLFSITDISKLTFLQVSIPNLSERRHFDTFNACTNESPNSDVGKFFKLEFQPCVHSRTLERR